MPAADKERTGDPPRHAVPSHRLAVRSPASIAMFLAVTAGGLAADLASKHLVFRSLMSRPGLENEIAAIRVHHVGEPSGKEVLQALQLRRAVCPGVHFTLSTNPGVVFGIGVPRAAVAVATVVTIALVLYFFAMSDRAAWAVHAALASILAGAMGNLYDRLFSEVRLPGAEPIRNQVRDFIDCSDLYYPYVFNVADILLVVGVALLIVHWWIAGRRPRAR